MSTNTVSGGFPHLYNHDVSGSFIDASAIRSVASADVAELHATLEPTIEIDDDVHMINVATKRALTVTEFKQLFYARGDDEFSIANVYECPNVDSNILASVWGKRVVHIRPSDPSNTTLPYNASRVLNYNKLSARPNDPSGIDSAYGYANDLQRNFYASHEVMGNLEKDLCMKNTHWTLCSRIAIEDQLQNLSFAPENTDDICMKVNCARKWSEVEDALAESCLAENNIIGLGDYVDLYINVRVVNGNPNTKDTVLRIRFTVQLTRGPDDLGNWNLVTAYIASAMLLTGIPYDQPEGGSFQYAANDPVEISPEMTNQERTQRPNTLLPTNLSSATDPHDTTQPPPYTYTWTHQNSTTTINLKSISIINDSEGWVCGWIPNLPQFNSIILKTINGGTTWTTDVANINRPTKYETISMFNDSFGFVAGGTNFIDKWDGVSWAATTGGTLLDVVNEIHCISSTVAWACGPKAALTADRCLLKWDDHPNAFIEPTTQPITNDIPKTVFVRDIDNICVAGRDASGNGDTWMTTNGGGVWRPGIFSGGDPSGLNSIFIVGDDGWCVGDRGEIIKTTNGGLNWDPQSSSTLVNLNDVYFTDSNTGWAVGRSGTILKTTNGGTTWVSEYSGTVEDLHDIHMISTTLGWIVGNNGIILKYS